MLTRFEQFSMAIACVYRYIQKIERMEMAKYGLKGPHAQCLLMMSRYPEGITSAQLCELCDKDKAAVSRTVAELEHCGMLRCEENNGKRYRARLYLTPAGQAAADGVEQRARVAVEQAGAGLEEEKRRAFYEVLGLIADNLGSISRYGLKEE